jgi:hypothetical protein
VSGKNVCFAKIKNLYPVTTKRYCEKRYTVGCTMRCIVFEDKAAKKIPSFIGKNISIFLYFYISIFLYFYISIFLYFYIPIFLYSYIPIFLYSYIADTL